MEYEDPVPTLLRSIRVTRQLFSEVSRAVNENVGVDGEGLLVRASAYLDLNGLGRPGMRLVCLLVL